MQFSNFSSLLIYLILFTVSAAIFSKCAKEISVYKQTLYMIVSSLFFALLSGLRYGVGTDYSKARSMQEAVACV